MRGCSSQSEHGERTSDLDFSLAAGRLNQPCNLGPFYADIKRRKIDVKNARHFTSRTHGIILLFTSAILRAKSISLHGVSNGLVGVGKKHRTMVIHEKAAPVAGTTLRFTGPMPADSRP